MNEISHCPDCGAELAAGTPKALCPQCALKGLLEPSEHGSASGAVPHGASEGEKPPAEPARAKAGVGRQFGDYELLEEIARGGMGVVYKARQKSLDRLVAVKFLLFGSQANAEFIKRFRIEASAAAALQHPNIVAIHEVGVHEGEHFLVMDYVDGPNLAKLVRDQPLPPKRAAQYLKTIAEAIHYAHERGILHRDLKPSNVLIDSSDQPRVTDFGLAKRFEVPISASPASVRQTNMAPAGTGAPVDSGITVSGQVMGSPAYMPPEQAAGSSNRGRVSRRSDVYSLGAMLYHLLASRPPFVGGTVAETLKQVEISEPVSLRLLSPSVPVDLETICLKCLEKEPNRRYQTANELAEELGRLLRDEPIQARPISRPEKLWRWCRRNPLAAAFVATVCAALVSSLWLLYLVNQEKNKQAALAIEVKVANRENNELLKRTLGMIEENLEGIWGNRERRSMPVSSEEVAALAQLPIQPVSDKAALVRWTVGIIAAEAPAGQARRHAKLLDELQARTSQSLGRPVRLDLAIYKFHEDIVADLFAGKLDFARMGALRFLRVRRSQPGIQPLVVPITAHKVGVLFTRPDTGIRSLGEVRGRSMAFGDTNATISYWAQIKLAEAGIAATNLARYDFLDSTLEFVDDVYELGYAEALGRIGYLHSHAQGIEGVLSGRYDVGVTGIKGLHIHQQRGLVAIPGTQFESSRTMWVARPGLDPRFAQVFIHAMTNLQGHWLEMLPEQSLGFRVLTTHDYTVEEQWLDRVDALFPPKPSPPRTPVPHTDKQRSLQ